MRLDKEERGLENVLQLHFEALTHFYLEVKAVARVLQELLILKLDAVLFNRNTNR